MAALGMSFDHTEVDPDAGFEMVPEGDYQLQIVEADVKANSKNTGQLLEFTAEIVDGDFARRKVIERLNIVHTNPTAQKIGQEQLSALLKAMEFDGVLTDSDDLLWKPFWAALKHEPYTDKNGNDRVSLKFKKYHFDTGSAPPASKPEPSASAERPAPPTASAAPSRPATKPAPAAQGGVAKKMPWQK